MIYASHKRLKILLVTNNYTPYCGGVVTSINATVDFLQQQGHAVDLVTLDFLGDRHTNDPSWVMRISCPIKFRYKSNYMAVPLRAYNFLTRMLNEKKPNLVHVHHPFLLGKVALRAAHQQGIPVVFTYHTMYEHYAHYVPLPIALMFPVIQKMVFSFCTSVDAVIAPSCAIQALLSAQKIKTPSEIIPSALRKEFLILLQEQVRENISKTYRLLYVGRFVPEKNIPLLLDAFALLPRGLCTLTLAGYGADYEMLRSYAYQKLQLSPHEVFFVLKPSCQELMNIYRDADIFLFPSHTDTQGLVIVEAMAAGCPVIAVHGAGQADIIVHGQNGFLVSNAFEKASAIMRLVGDSSLLMGMRHNAKKTAQRYHPDMVGNQLVNFYEEVIRKR